MKTLLIHATDNVEVALDGEFPGHKFARRAIRAGEPVVKYGMPIGIAKVDIAPGEHVHSHNLETALSGELEYTYKPTPIPALPQVEPRTFEGFRRADGQFGVRNDLWIIPLVACVNGLANNLVKAITPELPAGMRALALTHPYGCSQLGADHECTAELLASFCRHPNAGGVLVVSLGCENNTLESFRKRLGDYSCYNIDFMVAQQAGDEFSDGLEKLRKLLKKAQSFQRETLPASVLRVGLKCGGSDGFSGVTANPLIGRFSDLLAALGGSTVLTEVPEMFGAETLLMGRCVNREVFDKCVKMINDFKHYYAEHGQPCYENPSPGNKQGGITTLEDKSLGCVQKGGAGAVVDVLPYGGKLSRPGLSLLSGPGNDPVAATALAAAGCQIILFSTGRGTPFGTVVPTLKIATNNELAQNKSNWIDFNAGRALTGESLDDLGLELLDQVIDCASGAEARNEQYGYQEIAIFKSGVTL